MSRVDNEKFYTSAIKKHGTTPKGLNWRCKETQHIRFKTILELLPNDTKNYTLIDAGCGFGDFYHYFLKKKKQFKKYIGIDALIDMQIIASENTGCEIIIADITKDELPFADYHICSGALNILDRFETYLFIQNCYKSSKKGFIFNILHGEDDSQTFNYFTKEDIYKIANTLNVNKVVIKENYLEDDISFGFYKEDDF
jgi:SAM-dependent methyltransferase